MNLLTAFNTKEKKIILYFLDFIIITTSLAISTSLIFYPNLSHLNPTFFIISSLITLLKLSIFFIFGIYDYMWRYASKKEFLKVILACTSTVPILFFTNISTTIFLNTSYFSFRIIVINLILTIFWIVGARAILTSLYSFIVEKTAKNNDSPKKNVLIIGAGEAGHVIANEIIRNPYSKWKIQGFIDDKTELVGRKIHQIPVLGTTKQLNNLIKNKDINELIIAMPTASSNTIRSIIDTANQHGITCQTTPKLSDIIEGNLTINQIRNVKIEDLLGRSPVDINTQSISQYVSNKTILVTGAGGSIGSEICRQILRYGPSKLLLLDHAENSIYLIEQELQEIGNYTSKLIPIVQDIKIKFLLEKTFQKYRPNIIFHAAAHKHVPLMEDNVHEVIENNISGTKHIIELADQYETEKFVFISTDKAVNPTNVMGASKRVCELLVQTYSQKSKTIFSSVRFGNVLGSNGSVIPLFKRQINQGGPLTITHPDITRYFMTIPEAVSLVIQTGAQSLGGEIFILDMGAPIKILDLAKDLISLSGFNNNEIEIKFTGLRSGEKLYEELFYNKDNIKKTDFNKIFIGDKINTNTETAIILQTINELLDSNKNLNTEETKTQLFSLINSYKPVNEEIFQHN